jgi:hypothetical protein
LINSFADFSVSSQVKELYQYLNHNCLGFEIVAPFVEDEFLDLLLLIVYSSKKEDKIFLVLHLFHKEKKIILFLVILVRSVMFWQKMLNDV